MECPTCHGEGKVYDFEIPIWGSLTARSIAFRSVEEEPTQETNERATQEGKEFAKFIKATASGCFHDGLKEELNWELYKQSV